MSRSIIRMCRSPLLALPPSIGGLGGIGYGPAIALVGIVERDVHLGGAARHHHVRNAVLRFRRAPVGMECGRRADAGDQRVGVGIHLGRVDPDVPGVVAREGDLPVQARIGAEVGSARWIGRWQHRRIGRRIPARRRFVTRGIRPAAPGKQDQAACHRRTLQNSAHRTAPVIAVTQHIRHPSRTSLPFPCRSMLQKPASTPSIEGLRPPFLPTVKNVAAVVIDARARGTCIAT